jgi:hypothetical protein
MQAFRTAIVASPRPAFRALFALAVLVVLLGISIQTISPAPTQADRGGPIPRYQVAPGDSDCPACRPKVATILAPASARWSKNQAGLQIRAASPAT